MNSLIKDNVITQMQLRDNFAYIIEDSNDFVLSHYKAVQRIKNDICLKSMKMLFNGKIQIFYFTSNLVSLKDILPAIDIKNLIDILTNTLANIIELTNNGFLPLTNIDISVDKIFVDQSTNKVQLLFVPTSKGIYPDVNTFENQLRSGLIREISSYSQFKNQISRDICSMLSDTMLSISQLYTKLKSYSGAPIIEESFNNNNQSNNRGKAKLTLISLSPSNKNNITVNSEYFTIGKSLSCSAVIDSTNVISREHCAIKLRNNNYYVLDLNSTNGTYLNGMRLKPNEEYMLKNNDKLTIVSLDYKIEL